MAYSLVCALWGVSFFLLFSRLDRIIDNSSFHRFRYFLHQLPPISLIILALCITIYLLERIRILFFEKETRDFVINKKDHRFLKILHYFFIIFTLLLLSFDIYDILTSKLAWHTIFNMIDSPSMILLSLIISFLVLRWLENQSIRAIHNEAAGNSDIFRNLMLVRKGQDIARAYFNLGNIYFENKNFPKALQYFKKACKFGNKDACDKLKDLSCEEIKRDLRKENI
ncbi:tetratricopeptide repeat protein [Thermodesulfobium acidiphilum]|uniref:tetratricopeptide repeat protein n=1 Tax=Thermodesulfobium acidiphilum TaxID=1794699 RepID=UPI00190101E1|nr:tetratricopeptide repeat protein [Thermodesulfobium acidiphilum]